MLPLLQEITSEPFSGRGFLFVKKTREGVKKEMRHTYVADDNSAGDAQVLGESGQDISVKTVLVGTPVDGGKITLFNKRVAYTADTDNIAAVITVPTAAAGKNWTQVYDFGPAGLPLDGGSFHIDQDLDVTVVWEPVDDNPD